jgi:hypothetical protein
MIVTSHGFGGFTSPLMLKVFLPRPDESVMATSI